MIDILLVAVLALAIFLAMPRGQVESIVLRSVVTVGQAGIAVGMATVLYMLVVIVGAKLERAADGIPPGAARPELSI